MIRYVYVTYVFFYQTLYTNFYRFSCTLLWATRSFNRKPEILIYSPDKLEKTNRFLFEGIFRPYCGSFSLRFCHLLSAIMDIFPQFQFRLLTC